MRWNDIEQAYTDLDKKLENIVQWFLRVMRISRIDILTTLLKGLSILASFGIIYFMLTAKFNFYFQSFIYIVGFGTALLFPQSSRKFRVYNLMVFPFILSLPIFMAGYWAGILYEVAVILLFTTQYLRRNYFSNDNT